MNNDAYRSSRRPIVAVASAVATIVALAARPSAADTPDPAVAELTQPKSLVELGTGYVSKDSYKFGEYNGLQRRGGVSLGNVDVQGGGSYDSDSVRRWRLQAHDVGLETADATLEYKEQGRFKFNLGYDSLLRNQSDTYHTPYSGAGTSSLSLPAGWLRPVVPQANPNSLNYRALSPVAGEGSVVSPNGTVVAPTAAQLVLLQSIVTADTAGMHNFNLQTDRKRGDLGFAANLTPHLQFTANVRHEERNGFRPLGAATSAVQENSVIIPDVIDTRTDQLNAGLEYARRKGFVQLGYYGSIFHNRIGGMSWQDPNDPTKTATSSSAPSNQFHQLNLAGGFNFLSTVRLTGDASYGRSRQNEGFLSDPSLPIGLPETSAHALVVTKSANVRLAVRPWRKLSLLAHYKYDDRDNQTPVNTFVFYDVNLARAAAASPFNSALGLAPNTLGSNVNIFDNRPQSKKINQFDLDADYALLARQKLAAGFEWQKIERACDHTWTNCVNASESIERTLHGEWRASLLDSLTATLGAGYAERRVHYDPNAWLALVPMANVTPATPGATTSVYGYLGQTGLTGFGPLAGFPTTPLIGNAAVFSPNNNIVPQSLYGSRDNVTELPGMRRFNLADRDRRRVRSSLDWQSTERLSFTTTLELDDDDYNHSLYGLRRSTIWNAGLDTTYAVSDRLIVTGFISHESMRSKTAGDGYGTNSGTAFVGKAANTLVAGSCFTTVLAKNQNAKIDPCLNWTANMRDRADTVGFSLARREMLARRLDLRADVIFTRAVTNVDVLGASYSNNPFALAGAPALAGGVPAVFLIPSANLPPVTTRLFELRLSGRFAISKATDVRLLYAWQRMKAEDFAYAGMQYGTGTEQFPTNEQAPNYNVHLIAAYYTHRF